MESGITNDICFFFKRALPNYIDFLTTNIKITNYVVNNLNNEVTITTETPHNLEVNSFVFIHNVLYGYSISSIIEEEIEIQYLTQKLVKITFNKSIIANENQIIDIKGITTNPALNSKFIIYKCIADKNSDAVSYYGKYENTNIVTTGVNIVNEGAVYLPFTDDIFATNTINERTGFSTTMIGGTYNGLKIVKSIIDSTNFTIKLYENTAVLQPDVPSFIDYTNANIKINNQIFGVTSINNEILENAATHLQQNSLQSVFLISKNSNTSSAFGTSLTNETVNSSFGFDLLDEEIVFNCSLLFKVERKSYDTNTLHYVLGYQANQITDYFTRVMKSLSNRLFFETNVFLSNTAKTNVVYKSYFTGSANITNLNNVENGVFKSCNFNLKITRQEVNYGTFSINNFGIPIKEINLDVEFDSFDQKNVKVP